ncbi:hypothetical protein VaNZ11_003020 [Volvox africanus]|uniref:MATH domain-containing protein n=1 Tax=Volvox africanus TaxID=51714 RepID=A0ABQ5RUS6_9CHLO|nr:hypothetical protein VaNZ11_003020 [Volvox africanus]
MPGDSAHSSDGYHLTNRKQRRSRYHASNHWGPVECSTSDSEVEAPPHVHSYTGLAGCLETGSVRHVDTLCGTHTYAVVGYSLARAMGPGTRLCSDVFEVGGQLFRLEVYPAGLNTDTNKYVSLFLTTPGTTGLRYLLYELSILDKGPSQPQHITESCSAHTPSQTGRAAIVAPQIGVVAGFPKFIKANSLHRRARRFLPSDTLTIRATVKVLTGRSSFPVAIPGQTQLFSLQPNLGWGMPSVLAQQRSPFCVPSSLYSPAAAGAPAAPIAVGTQPLQPYTERIACRCGSQTQQPQAQVLYTPHLGGRQTEHLSLVPFPAATPPLAMALPQQAQFAAIPLSATFGHPGMMQ